MKIIKSHITKYFILILFAICFSASGQDSIGLFNLFEGKAVLLYKVSDSTLVLQYKIGKDIISVFVGFTESENNIILKGYNKKEVIKAFERVGFLDFFHDFDISQRTGNDVFHSYSEDLHMTQYLPFALGVGIYKNSNWISIAQKNTNLILVDVILKCCIDYNKFQTDTTIYTIQNGLPVLYQKKDIDFLIKLKKDSINHNSFDVPYNEYLYFYYDSSKQIHYRYKIDNTTGNEIITDKKVNYKNFISLPLLFKTINHDTIFESVSGKDNTKRLHYFSCVFKLLNNQAIVGTIDNKTTTDEIFNSLILHNINADTNPFIILTKENGIVKRFSKTETDLITLPETPTIIIIPPDDDYKYLVYLIPSCLLLIVIVIFGKKILKFLSTIFSKKEKNGEKKEEKPEDKGEGKSQKDVIVTQTYYDKLNKLIGLEEFKIPQKTILPDAYFELLYNKVAPLLKNKETEKKGPAESHITEPDKKESETKDTDKGNENKIQNNYYKLFHEILQLKEGEISAETDINDNIYEIFFNFLTKHDNDISNSLNEIFVLLNKINGHKAGTNYSNEKEKTQALQQLIISIKEKCESIRKKIEDEKEQYEILKDEKNKTEGELKKIIEAKNIAQLNDITKNYKQNNFYLRDLLQQIAKIKLNPDDDIQRKIKELNENSDNYLAIKKIFTNKRPQNTEDLCNCVSELFKNNSIFNNNASIWSSLLNNLQANNRKAIQIENNLKKYISKFEISDTPAVLKILEDNNLIKSGTSSQLSNVIENHYLLNAVISNPDKITESEKLKNTKLTECYAKSLQFDSFLLYGDCFNALSELSKKFWRNFHNFNDTERQVHFIFFSSLLASVSAVINSIIQKKPSNLQGRDLINIEIANYLFNNNIPLTRLSVADDENNIHADVKSLLKNYYGKIIDMNFINEIRKNRLNPTDCLYNYKYLFGYDDAWHIEIRKYIENKKLSPMPFITFDKFYQPQLYK